MTDWAKIAKRYMMKQPSSLSAEPAQDRKDDNLSAIDHVTIEEMQKVTFGAFLENYKNQMLLLLELKFNGSKEIYNEMKYCIEWGMYFQENKILPIVGKGYWSLEVWNKCRETLLQDEQGTRAIIEAISKVRVKKVSYGCCINDSVTTAKIKPKCNAPDWRYLQEDCYFCNCEYAKEQYKIKVEAIYNKFFSQEIKVNRPVDDTKFKERCAEIAERIRALKHAAVL